MIHKFAFIIMSTFIYQKGVDSQKGVVVYSSTLTAEVHMGNEN